jgi:hypothetical protein
MRREQMSSIFMVAIMAAVLAYIVMDSLIREYSRNVTVIDLGTIYVLGIITGTAFGAAFVSWRSQRDAS